MVVRSMVTTASQFSSIVAGHDTASIARKTDKRKLYAFTAAGDHPNRLTTETNHATPVSGKIEFSKGSWRRVADIHMK